MLKQHTSALHSRRALTNLHGALAQQDALARITCTCALHLHGELAHPNSAACATESTCAVRVLSRGVRAQQALVLPRIVPPPQTTLPRNAPPPQNTPLRIAPPLQNTLPHNAPPLQNALAQCEQEHRRAAQAQSSSSAGVDPAPGSSAAGQRADDLQQAEEDPFIARLRSDAAVARLLDEVR